MNFELRIILKMRFGILELPNRVTQNDITLRATNSIVKLLFFQLFIFNNRKQELIIVQGSFDKNIVQL